jgi:hypothetical protein
VSTAIVGLATFSHLHRVAGCSKYPLILLPQLSLTAVDCATIVIILGCDVVRGIFGLLALGGFLALSVLSATAQAPGKVHASYTISLLGLTVGKGVWDVEINGEQYSQSASGHISGVAASLISGEASASARGRFVNERPQPTEFEADAKTDAETDKIKMTFDATGITELVAEPPLPQKQERVPVTDADRQGVLDPLSAGLVIVAGSDTMLRPQSCDQRIPIFDGRRRFDVELSFKRMDKVKAEGGYQGPAIVCSIHLVPISGHRVNGTAVRHLVKSDAMEVTLVPLSGTRILVPFHASIPTLIGTVMVTAQALAVTSAPTSSGVSPSSK